MWSQRNFVGVFLAALAAPLSLWTVAFLLYASNARGLRGDSGGAGSGGASAGPRRRARSERQRLSAAGPLAFWRVRYVLEPALLIANLQCVGCV